MPIPKQDKIVASKRIKDKLYLVILKPNGKTYLEERTNYTCSKNPRIPCKKKKN